LCKRQGNGKIRDKRLAIFLTCGSWVNGETRDGDGPIRRLGSEGQ
jgi:hypothetical protein